MQGAAFLSFIKKEDLVFKEMKIYLKSIYQSILIFFDLDQIIILIKHIILVFIYILLLDEAPACMQPIKHEMRLNWSDFIKGNNNKSDQVQLRFENRMYVYLYNIYVKFFDGN